MKKLLTVILIIAALILMTSCPTDPPGDDGNNNNDTTAPAAVTLTITEAGFGKISLSWSEPADTDYSHLHISWTPGGTAGVDISTGTTGYQVTGLTNGTEYTVSGRTVDTSGNASASYSVTLTIPEDEMTVHYISTAAELAAIDDTPEGLNDYYILANDIDLTGINWDPIGYDPDIFDGTAENCFEGILEGNNCTISNLTIDSSLNGNTPESIGLFEAPAGNSAIRNLTIENADITGVVYGGGINQADWTGTLAGAVFSGEVSNCKSSGIVRGGNGGYPSTGGLIGRNSVDGRIAGCSSSAAVTGYSETGGLVGTNVGTVNGCFAAGNVSSENGTSGKWIGGLIGGNVSSDGTSGGLVTGCYATGDVSGEDQIGGLIGAMPSGEGVSDCYAEGDVTGYGEDIGGLIGEIAEGGMYDVSILDCYTLGNLTGESSSTKLGGLVGTVGATGTITGCTSSGTITGHTTIGGIAGSVYGRIEESYSNAAIELSQFDTPSLLNLQIGGIAGYSSASAVIAGCYTEVDIAGGYGSVMGGIIGSNAGQVQNCYATGNIVNQTGGTYGYDGLQIGGLAGYTTGWIAHSYSTGLVVGISDVGGLVGQLDTGGTVNNCFYDSTTSGQSDTGKGTPKTTGEMQTGSTFTDAGWDFEGETVNGSEDYWNRTDGTNGGYPYLTAF